ncbi:hypothetical protein G6F57_021573 [Rhizopus arrhizus]|nr:hypothetical protein G6F57_021573 [Rhizopus arrhizus]
MVILPTVAQVAADEPDTAAKMAQPITFDFSHPQEERQGGQGPAGRGAPDGDGHGVARRAAGEDLHADPGRACQRQADPDPAPQQDEDRDDQ